jgi:hypothetical protein
VKPETVTLDQRIADALATTEELATADLLALYNELDTAVGVAAPGNHGALGWLAPNADCP